MEQQRKTVAQQVSLKILCPSFTSRIRAKLQVEEDVEIFCLDQFIYFLANKWLSSSIVLGACSISEVSPAHGHNNLKVNLTEKFHHLFKGSALFWLF